MSLDKNKPEVKECTLSSCRQCNTTCTIPTSKNICLVIWKKSRTTFTRTKSYTANVTKKNHDTTVKLGQQREQCSSALKNYSPLLNGVKTSFSCWVARINVVLLLSSFNFDAPTYVHVDRTPPRMSRTVFSTGPRYSISTVFPSEALQFKYSWRYTAQNIKWLFQWFPTFFALCTLTMSSPFQNHMHQKISPVQGLTVDSSQLTSVPTSKSCDTKTRPNVKNLARSNLDLVP